MRWIIGGKATKGSGASPSQMGRFETNWLARPENLATLTDLSARWIELVSKHRSRKRVVLDMDSSVSPTHGDQESSVWNGHFGCTCYHPLFVFNQFGDLERCALRAGNVHSADAALMPLVQRERGSPPASRASLQSRELPPHARDSRGDCGVDADKSSREADQNRCQGRQSRSLRNVPDGGGRNPTEVVRCDNAEDCCTTIAPDGNVHMSNPVLIHVGQTSGEARPYEYAVGFWDGQRPKSWSVSCRSNRGRSPRRPETAGIMRRRLE
jgi:hypothetical protein